MNSFSSPFHGAYKHFLFTSLLLMLWSVAGISQSYNDVSLQATATPTQASVAEPIFFSIKISNEGMSDLTGLSVKVEELIGVFYTAHDAPAGTSFDPATGIWEIGDAMTQSVESLELTIESLAWEEGLAFAQAQIMTLNEMDVDSEAGNNLALEDDQSSACASIPHQVCTALGESVTLEAPAGLANYEWYFDDGTDLVLVSNDSILVATQPGSYTFLSNVNACGECCPIVLEENCEGNLPPLANFDTDSTGVNIPIDIAILDNDEDPEGDIDNNSINITDQPENGVAEVNPDGTITYTPGNDFFGLDTFIYQICDLGEPPLCDTAMVIIEVGDLVFDLALEKSLAPGQPMSVNIGDEVTYVITITNEGQFAASEITVVDYIPTGLIFSQNNPDWVLQPSGDAVISLSQPLLPGSTTSVEIKLLVVYGASGQTIENIAEVTSVKDSNGIPAQDVDSTPDNGNNDEDDMDNQIVELLPHDPTGYIYCDKTGKIITGGIITVEGPGEVFIVADGSEGYYEFYTDGTPGLYTMSFDHPEGYPMSADCLPQPGAFDPTGMSAPLVLGSDTLGMSLVDTACAANPFYMQFELEPGDPFVFNNNIPVQCCYIGSIVCVDTDGDGMPNPGAENVAGVTVSLFDCADTLNAMMTMETDDSGAFAFDGLPAGNYMLHFDAPPNYVIIDNGQLNEDGFSECIVLDPGECDTTTTACLYPCPSVNAGEDLFICQGDSAQLTASVEYGGGTFEWFPTIGLNDPNVAEPFVTASSSTVYYVTYADDLGCMSTDSVLVEVHTDCLVDIITDDSVTITANCDYGDPLYCFNVPFEDLADYSFELNGAPLEADFGPCDYLKGRYYTYGALQGLASGHEYEVQYWNAGGTQYAGQFQEIDELVAMMNQWDPAGMWEHKPGTKSILGGHPQTFYSKMYLRNLNNGTTIILDLYEQFVQNSSYLILPEGEHNLVVTDANGAVDSVFIRAACVQPEYVDIAIQAGESDTICLNINELEGEVTAIFDPCLPGFDEPADLTLIEGTNCVEAFGMYLGQTGGCYVICDELGICDTTYITVTVFDEEFLVNDDSLCTPKDTPIVGEVLQNDNIPAEVVSLNILAQPENGTAVVNPDNTITYTPDEGYCNDDDDEPLDMFIYEVCTSFACEQASVLVQVKCDGLVIYNGFSPNADGVNDYFKIDGLQAFEKHKLMVFNRWGNKVLQTDDYKNDWDGYWDGKRLPHGTYFYLIELNGGEQWMSGYLQIWW